MRSWRIPRTLSRYLPAVMAGVTLSARSADQEPDRIVLQSHVPGVVRRATPQGPLPAQTNLFLSIGMPVRDQAGLDDFLQTLQDRHSTNFHRYLTPRQFAERFGPREADYQAVVRFVRSNGFTVVGTHSNRLVLDVEAPVPEVERAFQVKLQTYRHPSEPRDFYAPDRDPSIPANLPVIEVEGLTDFWRPRPLLRPARTTPVQPLSGSAPSGFYAGNDFRRAYAPGTMLTGAGQAVGLLEFSGYFAADIASYEKTIGLVSNVPLVNVVVGHGPSPSTANNAEVALDIEVAIAMAPGLSQVIVYEENSVNPATILSRMANDNLAKQLSSSWSWSGGPSATIDSLFQQMAAQGQSFFQAAGDDDAYTGANALDDPTVSLAPVDSTNVISVGGTTLTMSGAGASWSSETVWNNNNLGGSFANTGSGGGISSYYKLPPWQKSVSMAANSGSTVWRNIPDVALTADQVYVTYDNGNSGGFGGTSCAAPLWAGFCALINELSTASGSSTVGFLNPALYELASSASYGACFHDITTGNNIGTNTPGLFNAVAGYDLCTGLGTPNGTNLINALVPYPHIAVQPVSQSVVIGSTVQFGVTATGQSPFGYRWFFNGTNLSSGGNITGTASNVLTITSVALANAGGYTVLVTNSYGTVTSVVASLSVRLLSSRVLVGGSANPSGFKEPLQFVATVTPTNAGGTVQFFANNHLFGAAPVAGGVAVSLALSDLPRGTNAVTAVYSGDATHLPATNAYAQVVTNHPPQAASFFTNGVSGIPLEIPLSTLASTWSDLDADTISLAAVDVSTNGITISNNGGSLVYLNPQAVDDLFVCTIRDSWGGTNSQTVYISLIPSSTPAIGATSGPNRTIVLQLVGSPGSTYILETANRLAAPADWLSIATNTLNASGIWQFSDTVTNGPARFYRLHAAP